MATNAITERIWKRANHLGASLWESSGWDSPDRMPAVVLFLIGNGDDGPELIFTRRSQRVRQPGDLCCPGGGVMPRLDPLLARLLRLPGSPLTRWRHWPDLVQQGPETANAFRLALAAALREGLEEMRLWPLGVQLLMPLPPHSLQMFRKQILPIACWVTRQRRFFPNWEVAHVVRMPIAHFMKPVGHAMLRLQLVDGSRRETIARRFPCFQFSSEFGTEVLWGATYRITADFMQRVLDYEPPDTADAPVIAISRNITYATGNDHKQLKTH